MNAMFQNGKTVSKAQLRPSLALGGEPPLSLDHVDELREVIAMAKREDGREKQGKKKTAKRKTAAKRELISPRGDARYIRRDAKGRIKESDDVGRSQRADRARKSEDQSKVGRG